MSKIEIPFNFKDDQLECFIDYHVNSYDFTDGLSMLIRAINITSTINNVSFASLASSNISDLKNEFSKAEQALIKGVGKNRKSYFEADLIFLQKGISIIRRTDNTSSGLIARLKNLAK